MILPSNKTVALLFKRATLAFFSGLIFVSCLPKAAKTDLRSGGPACADGENTCSAVQASWALAGVNGPVSRLENGTGFSAPEAVDSTLVPRPGDRIARLSNARQKASAELVKENNSVRVPVNLDSRIEMHFRPADRISGEGEKSPAGGGWFLRDAADADRVVAKDFKAAATGVAVLKIPQKDFAQGDYLLVRGAVPLEVKPEERVVCSGLSAALQVRAEGVSKPLVGGKASFDQLSLHKTVTLQAMVRVVDASSLSLELAVIGDKPACNLKVLEPATFTVLIFSNMTRLADFSSSAKLLVDAFSSNAGDFAAPERVTTAKAGPSIVTIARKEWRHQKDDFLLVDASVTLSAEDRISETSGWLQLTRSPSGLNSHLQVNSQTAQDGPLLRNLQDWAYSPSGEGRTTFYLNIMSTGENEKPIGVKEPSIMFLHFGSVAAASTQVAALMTQKKESAGAPASSGAAVAGREVDLHVLRSLMTQNAVRPAEDGLPCSLFKAGSTRIQGAPALDIPTPLHHRFKTRWVGDKIVFPMVIYENIYHQAPVWTLSPPAGREDVYADRFYEVTVINPALTTCKISAVRK